MHLRHPTEVRDDGSAKVADRNEAAPGLPGELGSALVEFARRLANFGLGEAEPPLLDEFVERRSRPRLSA